MKFFKRKKETETENRTDEFYDLVKYLSCEDFTETLTKLNERNPIEYKNIIVWDYDDTYEVYCLNDLIGLFEDFEVCLELNVAVGLYETGVLEIVPCGVSEDELEEWENEKNE